MSKQCNTPQVKSIVIKRFGVPGLTPTIPTSQDCNLWSKTDLKDGELALNIKDKKLYIRAENQILELTNQSSNNIISGGTVTSVSLSMPSAFTVSNNPITTSGTLNVTAIGNSNQYIRGDGTLANFPASGLPAGNNGEIQFNNNNTFGADSNLFWNNTTKRLSLGTSINTLSRLLILGTGTTISTNSLEVHNSTGTNNSFVIKDNGYVGIGTNNPQQLVHVIGGIVRIQSTLTGGNATAGQLQFGNTGTSNIFATNTGGGPSGGFSIGTMNASVDNSFFQLRVSNLQGLNIFPRRTYDGLGLRGGFVVEGNPTGGSTNIEGIDFVSNNSNLNNWQEPAFRFYSAYRPAVGNDGYLRFSINNVTTTRSSNNINIGEIKGVRSIWGITDNDTITPNDSAVLDLQSNTRGFLPPRNANPPINIISPVEGLIVFNTITKKHQGYDGTSWQNLY